MTYTSLPPAVVRSAADIHEDGARAGALAAVAVLSRAYTALLSLPDTPAQQEGRRRWAAGLAALADALPKLSASDRERMFSYCFPGGESEASDAGEAL